MSSGHKFLHTRNTSHSNKNTIGFLKVKCIGKTKKHYLNQNREIFPAKNYYLQKPYQFDMFLYNLIWNLELISTISLVLDKTT